MSEYTVGHATSLQGRYCEKMEKCGNPLNTADLSGFCENEAAEEGKSLRMQTSSSQKLS